MSKMAEENKEGYDEATGQYHMTPAMRDRAAKRLGIATIGLIVLGGLGIGVGIHYAVKASEREKIAQRERLSEEYRPHVLHNLGDVNGDSFDDFLQVPNDPAGNSNLYMGTSWGDLVNAKQFLRNSGFSNEEVSRIYEQIQERLDDNATDSVVFNKPRPYSEVVKSVFDELEGDSK
jgi:hypothetical protein